MKCGCKLKNVMGLCERKATVLRDDRWYCWYHDPVRVEAEAQKVAAARRKEHADREAKVDARMARRDLERSAEVDNLSDSDLREIIKLGGIHAMISRMTKSE